MKKCRGRATNGSGGGEEKMMKEKKKYMGLEIV